MEALEIDATPMTLDQIFEREQAIEAKWLEQFRELEQEITQRFENRDAYKTAQAKIGEAAQSALHAKGVVIPSLYQQSGSSGTISYPTIDDNAVVEVVDATVTYITMGRDFEIILQAIKDNPSLKSEWENFMMMLRLAEQ